MVNPDLSIYYLNENVYFSKSHTCISMKYVYGYGIYNVIFKLLWHLLLIYQLYIFSMIFPPKSPQFYNSECKAKDRYLKQKAAFTIWKTVVLDVV